MLSIRARNLAPTDTFTLRRTAEQPSTLPDSTPNESPPVHKTGLLMRPRHMSRVAPASLVLAAILALPVASWAQETQPATPSTEPAAAKPIKEPEAPPASGHTDPRIDATTGR